MKTLPWPKSMKWSNGTRLWVRPLQSVIALFDGQVLSGEGGTGGDDGPDPVRQFHSAAIAS
jgi:glycyl-tRNA synthetase beta chain